jgi:hypothetical protein
MERIDPKKPYTKPTLVVYGQIRDLTKAVGGTGMNDGNTTGRTKTKFP